MSGSGEDDLNDQLEDEEEDEQPSSAPATGKGSKRKAAQQFFEDAADEDDEEEEEEEEEERGAGGERRHKKRSVFIDDIADVDDDEEEEEEDEEEAGDLIDDQDTVAEQAERSAADHAQFRQLNRQQEEKSAEEIARHIEERYKAMEEGGPGYEDEDMLTGATGAVGQQAMLPTVNDPKLWMVRARAGHEREACIQLLQKSYNMHRKGTPILIKSAFALDHLKEYVYIEAEKEAHVRDAIRGIRTVFVSKGVRLVPLSEMVHAVTVNRAAKSTIVRGTWVRVRTGLYKDDLAEVVDVDAATNRAVVRLVPRLDLQAMAARAQDPEARKKNPFGRVGPVRPPARAFNPEEARELALLVTRVPGVDGQTYLQLGSNRFISGYLEKAINLRSLTPIDGAPPLEDLQRFKACGMAADENQMAGGADGDLSSLMAALPSGVAPKTHFVEGDLVMIVKGDLKNLEAEVETTRDDGKVMVRPKVQDFNEAVDFDADELRKVFKVGDRVRLISGTYTGETGMVLQMQDNDQCIVISDTTKQELKVFGRDLTRSDEPDTGVETLGEYQLHDLVLLDQSTAGVIIQIQRDAARVLTSNSTPGLHDIRVVRSADIQRKLNAKNMVTTDASMNKIRAEDLVNFNMGGPHSVQNRAGTVKYIWRGMLFVKGKEFLDAGGFEVVRANKCKLRGAPSNNADLARIVASGSHGTPMRTPQSPGHGFTSRTPTMYAPASPGNFAPAARVAAGATTPSNPGGFPAPGGFPPPGGYPPPGGRGAGPMRPPAAGGFGGRGRGAGLNSLIGRTIRVRGGQYNGYRGRVKHETPSHVQVEFDAISNRLITVERRLCHDEATLTGPHPVAAPSQGPPRGVPGGFSAPGGFGSRGGASVPGGFGSRGGLNGMRGSDYGGAGAYPQTPLHHSMTPMHPSMTPAHPSMTPAAAPYTPMHAPTPTPGDDNDFMLGGASDYQDNVRGATASTPGYDSALTPKAYTPSIYAANEPQHAPTPSWHEQDPQGAMATADTPSLAPTPGGAHPGPAPTPYLQHNTNAITPSLTPGGSGPTPGAFTGFTPAAQTPGMDLGQDLQGDGLPAGGFGGVGNETLHHWEGVVVQARGDAGKSWLVRGADPGGLLRLSGGHWGSRSFVEMAGTEELQEASSVDLVRPNKKDQVKVVQSLLDEQAMHVGRTGTLIAMDASNEGIIKLDTGEVIVMDMSCIGKLGAQ